MANGSPMNRYTFVVQVHLEGISTLENVSTNERVALAELAEVAPRIERWLAELPEREAAVRQPPQRS
jgi:hypothetical protein